MELARSEFAKKRGRNWGKEQAQKTISLESRGKIKAYGVLHSQRVQEALVEFTTASGTLDLRNHVNRLTNDELWAVVRACEAPVKSLSIAGWNNMEPKCLRSLSLVVGNDLQTADLSSSPLTDLMLETFCSRLYTLKTLRVANCKSLGNIGIRALTLVAYSCLSSLDVSGCLNLSSEALHWLGGTAGFNHPPSSKLQSLDCSNCPKVKSDGLASLGEGCKKLRFINLTDCTGITNDGIKKLAKGCRALRVINLYGCLSINDVALKSLGKFCSKLRSLNVGRCGGMTDAGVTALARGCPKLQALNIAGSRTVSESSIYELVSNCKGLQTLNLTGCENVTVNGLKAMVQGLKFVQPAKGFFGFVPLDEATDKKLNHQQELIEHRSAKLIQKFWHDCQAKAKAIDFAKELRLLRAALKVQRFWRNLKQRRKWASIERLKLKNRSATLIQVAYRGYHTRMQLEFIRRQTALFMAKRPYAVKIQALYRGFMTRQHSNDLKQALTTLLNRRTSEAHHAVATGIQASWRRYVAHRKVEAVREIMQRRKLDMYQAAFKIQMTARAYIARVEFMRKKAEKERIDALHKQAATRIQAFWRGTQGKFSSLLRKQELARLIRVRNRKATKIQAFYRGHRAREHVNALRYEIQLREESATKIQSVWRSIQVLHWRDIRMNKVAAFIFKRQELETLQRARDVEERLLLGGQKAGGGAVVSSSSEEESQGEEEFWQERQDQEGRSYWFNQMTTEESYLVPDTRKFEKDLVGMTCRVFWPMENDWFEAEIVKWSRKKEQHKIIYNDGDNEYMNLEEEYERIQLLIDEVWIPFNMHIPDWKKEQADANKEFHTRQKINKKLLAADQHWLKFWDEESQKMRWFNEQTGKMKYALEDAESWVMIEDEAGFIRYMNKFTSERVVEDPRFEIDEEALEKAKKEQKDKEEAELEKIRFSLYFVQHMMEEYTKALEESERAVQKVLRKIAAETDTTKLGAALHHAKEVFPKDDYNKNEEIKYAGEVLRYVNELKEMAKEDGEELRKRRNQNLSVFHEKKVYHCTTCSKEVEKNMKFCPHCNARLLF